MMMMVNCLAFPVDTGRKLDVHKTYRRRPEVLRPVSMGLFRTIFRDSDRHTSTTRREEALNLCRI